jgi:hypothetical protein
MYFFAGGEEQEVTNGLVDVVLGVPLIPFSDFDYSLPD